jgi:aminopeptidase YwaD
MRCLYFILFQLFCFQVHAQSEIELAIRSYVDTLCSPTFFGRGYEHKGADKAGSFIADFVREQGLKPIQDSYSQKYAFKVVEHSGNQNLRINRKALLLGHDYFPHPSNGNAHDSGRVVSPRLGKTPSQKKIAHKLKRSLKKGEYWLLSNSAFWKTNWQLKNFIDNYQVCFWEEEKLTGHISATLFNQPSFYVKKGALNSGDQVDFTTSGSLNETQQRNVFGLVPGVTDSLIVFTAHYDHIGGWGDHVFVPGANDNASGTALLMGLIRLVQQDSVPPHSLVFVFFSGEEAGLKGSKFFVDNIPLDTSKIKAVYNLDLVGTGSDGITVVNGTEEVSLFHKIQKIGQPLFPKIVVRGQAANSDHYWFSKQGIPAVFIYGMGPRTAYHDVTDIPETMPQPMLGAFISLLKNLIYE